jgi:hypothetical protein
MLFYYIVPKEMSHSTLRMKIKEVLTLVVFETQTSTVNDRKFEVEKKFLQATNKKCLMNNKVESP